MRKAFLLFCCVSAVLLFSSWGFLGHRTIHQLAVYQLPKKIKPFFYTELKYLVYNSVRPDERRSADPMEASKHFIDLEAYGADAAVSMPINWNEAVAMYSKDSLLKYGYVPYWVVAMQQKLTEAFRAGNKDSILFYAADLGHYISDAHVPLHTSLNYDGQLSGQKGLHSLWETMVPEIEINNYDLYNHHHAQYIAHPAEAIWKAVRQAHLLVGAVFTEEIEATKEFTDATKYRIQQRNGREVKSYSTEFAKAYSKRLGATINQQLVSAASLCSDFWYTAWVDAGKPDLNVTFNKSQKKEYKKEYKRYKKNELIQQGLLLSRQTKTGED